MKLQNKIVNIVANSEAGERCHCYLLDTYINHLPEIRNTFYVRPLEKATANKVWYSSVPVGKNKLAKIVSDLSKESNWSY